MASYQEKIVLAALSISRDNIGIRGYEIKGYDMDGDLLIQPWADMNAVFQGRKMDTIERRDLALVRVSRYGSIFCNDNTISYDLLERMRLLEEIRNLPNESFDNIPF